MPLKKTDHNFARINIIEEEELLELELNISVKPIEEWLEQI